MSRDMKTSSPMVIPISQRDLGDMIILRAQIEQRVCARTAVVIVGVFESVGD